MTPEQAIPVARWISRRYGNLADEAESAALLGYLRATRSWRPDGGATFGTYARWCMRGEARDAVSNAMRHRELPIGLCDRAEARPEPERSDPARILRRLTGRVGWRDARVAWLVWGLEKTQAEVARRMGVSFQRISKVLQEVRTRCAG